MHGGGDVGGTKVGVKAADEKALSGKDDDSLLRS